MTQYCRNEGICSAVGLLCVETEGSRARNELDLNLKGL